MAATNLHPLNSRANIICLRDKANLGNARPTAEKANAFHNAFNLLFPRRVHNKTEAKHQNRIFSNAAFASVSFFNAEWQA